MALACFDYLFINYYLSYSSFCRIPLSDRNLIVGFLKSIWGCSSFTTLSISKCSVYSILFSTFSSSTWILAILLIISIVYDFSSSTSTLVINIWSATIKLPWISLSSKTSCFSIFSSTLILPWLLLLLMLLRSSCGSYATSFVFYWAAAWLPLLCDLY